MKDAFTVPETRCDNGSEVATYFSSDCICVNNSFKKGLRSDTLPIRWGAASVFPPARCYRRLGFIFCRCTAASSFSAEVKLVLTSCRRDSVLTRAVSAQKLSAAFGFSLRVLVEFCEETLADIQTIEQIYSVIQSLPGSTNIGPL